MSKVTLKNLIILFLISISIGYAAAEMSSSAVSPEYWDRTFYQNLINIRSPNGKLYAYIVLLFNENTHFVNLIQEGSIPEQMIQEEGFHIREYENYIKTIKDQKIKKIANTLIDIYKHPEDFNEKTLNSIGDSLARNKVILRFSKDKRAKKEKITLDYCIFGIKRLLNITHPLFNIKEKIYNIQPLIYYDEFSTSNSTFYFDMIYINHEEVYNDYIIAKKVLKGENVSSMFFVGSSVNNNIKYCIAKAFKGKKSIKREILRMFEIHELTHKILNNHYDYFDQVSGEEIALLSTIYFNPYLGLSVLYSYLQYNPINPHRIAALNFVRSVANKTGKLDMLDDPSSLKYLTPGSIKKYTREHFNSIIKTLK